MSFWSRLFGKRDVKREAELDAEFLDDVIELSKVLNIICERLLQYRGRGSSRLVPMAEPFVDLVAAYDRAVFHSRSRKEAIACLWLLKEHLNRLVVTANDSGINFAAEFVPDRYEALQLIYEAHSPRMGRETGLEADLRIEADSSFWSKLFGNRDSKGEVSLRSALKALDAVGAASSADSESDSSTLDTTKTRQGRLEMSTPHTVGFVPAKLKECHFYILGETNAGQQQMMMEMIAAKGISEYPNRFMESILPGFGLLEGYDFKASRTSRDDPEIPSLEEENHNAVFFTVHLPLPVGVFEASVWLVAEIPSVSNTVVLGISNDGDVEETLRNTIRVV